MDMDTVQFLNSLWYKWALSLFKTIYEKYELNEEQREALERAFLKPNDWIVEILPPISGST